MKLVFILFASFTIINAASLKHEEPKVNYEGYKVYKVKIANKEQRSIIQELANKLEVSIWHEDVEDIDLMVDPKYLSDFKNVTLSRGIANFEMISNLQSLINEEQNIAGDTLDNTEFSWTRYHKLPEIEAFIDSILSKYSSVAEEFVVGQSYEGRKIRGIKISYKAGNPGIFIESNIHAREWITSATATWFINQLLTSTDTNVRNLAENYDWYIVPVLNVDGFVYSHEKDRLWRKTRQPVEHSNCVGTDGNRNFDSYWGLEGGSSSNPCDYDYAGPKPFSEPEIKGLADYLQANKNKFNILVAFHCYGQVLLSPYGHSTEILPENYNDLMKVAKAYADAVGNLSFGTQYTYGTSAGAMYLATGATIEYGYNEVDIKLTYTIEMRDTGRYGFVLPPVQILPNCEETMSGILALVKEAEQLGYLKFIDGFSFSLFLNGSQTTPIIMRLILILATLVVCASAASLHKQPSVNDSGKIRYDDYKVYKLNIKNRVQLSIINIIQDLSEKYNIWKDYDEATKEIHIMVKPQEVSNFLQLLKVYGFESELMINNVQELIDVEETASELSADNAEFGWTRYYQLHEIEQWLDGILAAYPSVTEGFEVGKSYENRTIRGIKISHKAGNPGIFIESNIHAREWITSATATWFINQLLTSQDPAVRNLAESYDWYIIPVFNVDGFVYSHEKDRMWRKTRQPVESNACIGTDANRNFDSHWMANGGASSNPCSETYAGPNAFSEPEAAALAKYVTSIKDKIKIYLSFHSYGQYLLSPYGHTGQEFPENYDDIVTIGKAFHDAIADLPYKTEYRYGSTATVLYVASGSSVDWVFNTLDVKIGYTIEYRDKGRYGFVLPPVQILPNCEELMAGMIALIGKSKELNYL